ncbi:MAG TPA: hypothetical protein VK568_09760 [Thermodesulfobacteriota bacterium]|jgi:hypothetical protein|nr:hypothetical protein [Thermodesulfobacteriota bacterium]
MEQGKGPFDAIHWKKGRLEKRKVGQGREFRARQEKFRRIGNYFSEEKDRR